MGGDVLVHRRAVVEVEPGGLRDVARRGDVDGVGHEDDEAEVRMPTAGPELEGVGYDGQWLEAVRIQVESHLLEDLPAGGRAERLVLGLDMAPDSPPSSAVAGQQDPAVRGGEQDGRHRMPGLAACGGQSGEGEQPGELAGRIGRRDRAELDRAEPL